MFACIINSLYIRLDFNKSIMDFDQYVFCFNEHIKMTDTLVAHMAADDLLRRLVFDAYNRKVTSIQLLQLVEMYDKVKKHYV